MPTLWIVKVDEFDDMITPVEYYGPIKINHPTIWRGFNNNEFLGPDVTELQWPNACKYRNNAWLIVGTRPFRPMPRAMRFTLRARNKPIGAIPAGIVGHEFLIVDESAGEPDNTKAVYTGTDAGSPYDCRLFLRTIDQFHSTASGALEFDDDDFTMFTLLTYVDGSDRWSLLRAPDDWNLADPLPIVETPTLAFSKNTDFEDLGGRQLVFFAEPDVVEVCTINVQLPYEDTWPFALPTQFIQVTPNPATLYTVNVIDPIIGPAEGLSRIVYEWAKFGVTGTAVIEVRWNGIIGRHFVEVRINQPGNTYVIDGGSHPGGFDVELELRQNGPIMRIDVTVAGGFKGTTVDPATYEKCNNRLYGFVSNYDVPHLRRFDLKTVL